MDSNLKADKLVPKSRHSSFFEEPIMGSIKKYSYAENSGRTNPRKESSNLHDSCRGNEEAEEFFEAFEDLTEMLEAEKAITDNNVLKLDVGRELSSAKLKSQTTFQIFTLKYVRWSLDIGIQGLSLEVLNKLLSK